MSIKHCPEPNFSAVPTVLPIPASKIIVFAWVNDEKLAISSGSSTDAYREFSENVSVITPQDWENLLEEAKGVKLTLRKE